jgi:uncharacterized protein YoxC
MSGGEIAGIIFASGFVLLVFFLGIPLTKLGKVLDESANAVKSVNKEIEPMLAEVRVTLTEANKQLKRIDQITKDVEQVTENISSVIAVFTAAIGAPLTKILGVTQGIFKAFGKRR